MKTDIIIPKSNVKEMQDFGYLLGFEKIVSVPGDAFIIETSSKPALSREVKRLNSQKKLSVVHAQTDLFNRYAVEKSGCSALLNPELTHKKDHLHFRRSGLDQVILRFAKQKNVQIFSALSSDPLILGRQAQNLRLCLKFSVPYHLVTLAGTKLEMRNWHDILSLTNVLSRNI